MTFLAPLLPYLAAAGTAASLAGTAVSAIDNRRARKEQKRKNNEFLQFQRNKQLEFQAAEDRNRQDALRVQRQDLAQQDIGAQDQVLQDETARLTDVFGGSQPALQASASDALFSGQRFGSQNFQQDLGRRLSEATDEARQRIQSLAAASAYGGSGGGLGTLETIRGAQTRGDLGFINQLRNNNTDILRRHQARPPEVVSHNGSTLGDLLSGFGTVGEAAGLGDLFGPDLPHIADQSQLTGRTFAVPSTGGVSRSPLAPI